MLGNKKRKIKKVLFHSRVWIKTSMTLFGLSSTVLAAGPVDVEPPQPSQQNISVFFEKLSQRLVGVFGEVQDLLGDKKLSSFVSSGNEVSESNEVSNVLFSQFSGVEIGFFSDLDEDSLHAEAIALFARAGIVNTQQAKFYPLNYAREGEVQKMLFNLLKIKGVDVGDTTSSEFFSGLGLSFMSGESLLTKARLQSYIDIVSSRFPHLVQSDFVVGTSQLYVKRGTLVQYLVEYTSFSDFMQTYTGIVYSPGFGDVQGHQYQKDIENLLSRGVISMSNKKFYPDNYLRRYELALFLDKVLASSSACATAVRDLEDTYFDAVCRGVSQGYLLGLLSGNDVSGKLYLPNKQVTWNELQSVFSALDIDIQSGSDALVKRGEFASILVKFLDNKFPSIEIEKEPAEVLGPLTSKKTFSLSTLLSWIE